MSGTPIMALEFRLPRGLLSLMRAGEFYGVARMYGFDWMAEDDQHDITWAAQTIETLLVALDHLDETLARVDDHAGSIAFNSDELNAWWQTPAECSCDLMNWRAQALRAVAGMVGAFDPAWLERNGGAAGAVARGVCGGEADGLAVLADALEEGGCETLWLLDRCRHPRSLGRHSWVVDLLLACALGTYGHPPTRCPG